MFARKHPRQGILRCNSHILHRPVELYALGATGKRVDHGNQRGGYRLQPLRNISVTYASRVYPSLSLPLDSPTAVRTSPARVARHSCYSRGVHILMDGKGRWPGNVYVERLWRSLKQEEVYWHAYETVSEAKKEIADYLRYFNEERPHQGLDNRTPDDVFYKRKPLPKAA